MQYACSSWTRLEYNVCEAFAYSTNFNSSDLSRNLFFSYCEISAATLTFFTVQFSLFIHAIRT